MAGTLIPAFSAALLAMQATGGLPTRSQLQTPEFESADGVCTAVRSLRYPPDIEQGVAATFVLQGQNDIRGPGGLPQELTAPFNIETIDQLRGGLGSLHLLLLSMRTPVTSREAMDRAVGYACRLEQVANLRLTLIRIVHARALRQLAQAETAEREAQERARLRRLAEQQAALQRLLVTPPTTDELTVFIARRWVEIISSGFMPRDSVFSRVHDAQCERRGAEFHCRIGILASSSRGPEYEQIERDVERDRDGNVVDPEVVLHEGPRPPRP